MSHSITIHQNIGGNPVWANPNLWTGDKDGKPVTPKHGEDCYLWVNVENNGTEEDKIISVSFYILQPAAGLTWPEISFGVGSANSIAVGANKNIVCGTVWKPDSSKDAHQCLVAVVSCMDCPPPPTTPGTKVNASLDQVAQHNVSIQKLEGRQNIILRPFHVINAKSAGRIVVARKTLTDYASVLKRRGIAPGIKEAPNEQSSKIVRQSDGVVMGDNVMNFSAGETHALNLSVSFIEHKPGTAALYDVMQYEDNELKGGVSLIVIH